MMIDVDNLAKESLRICEQRNWSTKWTDRGVYLHLEASELIESLRGKGGDPVDEAGDVLFVLMSITEANGIPFSDVVEAMQAKIKVLETSPNIRGRVGRLVTFKKS